MNYNSDLDITLDVLQNSYAINLNYGQNARDSIPVNSFCITNFIDASTSNYKTGVSTYTDPANVIVEFTAYSYDNLSEEFKLNPEYKLYMPLTNFKSLVESDIGERNRENIAFNFADNPDKMTVNRISTALEEYLVSNQLYPNKVSGFDISEQSIPMDELNATYVRIDPITNEAQILGDNYSVVLYDLGKILRKIKTPDYGRGGRTR